MKIKILFISLITLLFSSNSFANIYTVNIANGNDWTPLVNSLSWAANQANGNAGRDTIVFDLPGNSQLTGAVNFIVFSEEVFIDGLSETDFVSNPNYIISTIPFHLTGDDVLVKGLEFNTGIKGGADSFRITGSNNTLDSVEVYNPSSRCVHILTGSGNTLIRSVFSGGQNIHSISIENSTNNLVDNCTINNADQNGILIITNSNNCTVRNCEISNNNINGIGIATSTGSEIYNCVFRDNTIGGVSIEESSNNSVVLNVQCYDNGENGLNLAGVSNCDVDSVESYRNGSHGVSVQQDWLNTASTGNTLDHITSYENSVHGVYLELNCINNTFNKIESHDNGINGFRIEGANNTVQESISYNHDKSGIHITASGNTVLNTAVFNNNLVLDLNASLPIIEQGAVFVNAANTTIEDNYIYDNRANGVIVYHTGATNNQSDIRGNIIGRDTLDVDSGNDWNGVFIWRANNVNIESNTIVDNGAGALHNPVLGNTYYMPDRISGVRFQDVTSGDLADNFIGTDPAQSNSGNAFDGITLHTNANNITVDNNIIVNNGFNSVYGVGGGIALRNASNNNTFTRNYIGAHSDDTPAANGDYGISVEGSNNNTIGGDDALDGNVISGATGRGIWLVIGSSSNSVFNNRIGDYTGSTPALANRYGIEIERDALNNIVGDIDDRGNTISGNQRGIYVHTANATNNTLRGNSFSCNSQYGIFLDNDGNEMYGKPGGNKNITVNTGENRPNFVSGYAPTAGALIDIYVEDTDCDIDCDDNAYQGMTYVTTVTATSTFEADPLANGYFWEYDLSDASNGGQVTKDNIVVQATETGANPNSSEFSTCIQLLSCTPPDNVVITAANNEICEGQQMTLTANSTNKDTVAFDYVYTWYTGSIDPANIVSDGNVNDSTLTVDTAATYFVRIGVQGDEATCNGESVGFVFTVNPLPVVSISPTSPDFCEGDSVEIDAGLIPNADYLWSPNGETTQSVFATTGGEYKVIVTETINGCIDSASVTVSENPNPVVDLGPDSAFCVGSSFELNAGPGDTYVWNGDASENGQFFTAVLGDSTYTVSVTTSDGCSGSDSIYLGEWFVPAVEIFGGDTNICSLEGESYIAFAVYTDNVDVEWSDFTTDTSAVVTTAPSDLSVTVTDENGCEDSDQISIEEKCEPCDALLPNVFVPGGGFNDFVEPLDNPECGEDITSSIIESHFEVYNRWGRKVHESETLPKWDGTFNGNYVSAGTYFWIWKYTDSTLEQYEKNGFVQMLDPNGN